MSSKMRNEIEEIQEVSARFFKADRERLDRFRQLLYKKRRLVLTGTGASLNACLAAQNAFIQYAGRIPHVMPAADIELLDACLNEDTLVMIVSQSGQSYETKTALHYLKSRGAAVWGVTNEPESPLARQSDERFLMNAGEEVSSATKTYAAALLILFSLAGGERLTGKLKQIPNDVRQIIRSSENHIQAWAEALIAHDVYYVLGEGGFAVTARQGALVLKEKTFRHVEGMSLSEFRHGNIEVLRDGLPIIVIAAADTARSSLKHAEYLASLSAEVYLIADRDFQSKQIPAERTLVLPEQSDAVTGQIAAVLPLMLLAERIASLKGYDIDGFRHISKVVDRY